MLILNRWMTIRNEPEDRFLSKLEPDPSIQTWKLFPEAYICILAKKKPSQDTVLNYTSIMMAEWERITSRSISKTVKTDVFNVSHRSITPLQASTYLLWKKHIRNVLTPRHKLPTEHREKFQVTAKDIDLLLRRLFQDDDHDYVHERARFQNGFALSLFSGSGARAGSIVESSDYRGTNEALFYEVSRRPCYISKLQKTKSLMKST